MLRELFPICRSITGDGVRQTLRRLAETTPLDIHEVPSGTQVFDWQVPDEWNIRDAYIADSGGRRIIDFRRSNLHVVSYSEPIDREMDFPELREHLHTLPAMPDAIPYRTRYYSRGWGFCLSQNQCDAMDPAERYRVVIDSTLAPGSLSYGERRLSGHDGDGGEYLISTYCCHPSLANDNLSGVVLWTLLLRALEGRRLRHSYRFIVIPETIGAITYLARNADACLGISGGYVLTCVAGPGPFAYKRSFTSLTGGQSMVDRAALLSLRERNLEFIDHPFDINGSDERQYSQPHWRIPVGSICKDKYYDYHEYHTSADNLDFVSAESLADTLEIYLSVIEKLELNCAYRSLMPYCEPMLGRRNMYPSTGGAMHQGAAAGSHTGLQAVRMRPELESILWTMQAADGSTDLMALAERTGFAVRQLAATAERLVEHGLLERIGGR
ncbi:hypothetical protein WV31_13140 [Magnetospirillum sp. ME-1]|nr:hypothetical protein WV31_13140 [Magnetospirillum sp. ME-1]